ncbi:MAG: DUF4157 domain-containing protein [Chitinophagaceae bacterium]|nr:MAG: DUF4157 domain-containing protein [Chitinophagaceae bacterium]
MQNKPADIKFYIRENSWLARMAAWKLSAGSVAFVLGSTIHLHNVTKKEFLESESWVKHELCHVRQYQRYGFLNFISKYLWESIRHGYYNNKFEIEARNAETIA